jgi:hypothetical protein
MWEEKELHGLQIDNGDLIKEMKEVEKVSGG